MNSTTNAARFETACIITPDLEDLLYQSACVLESTGMSFALAVHTISDALMSPPVQATFHDQIHRAHPRYPVPSLQRYRIVRDTAQRQPKTLAHANQHATTPDNIV